MPDLVCADCGQSYRANAGHCAGGRYEGCCKSLRANRDFDQHRTGRFGDGSRRCLTAEEMREKCWEFRDGLWTSPESQRQAAALRARKQLALVQTATERPSPYPSATQP